jgi:hypothetical protein
MATITLIGPRRLNIGGVLYTRGEMTEVEDHVAIGLEEDPRFKVRGISAGTPHSRLPSPVPGKPMGDRLLAAINDAIADLEVDDDDAFDRNGKPSLLSLAAILGYPVSAQERDRALAKQQSKGQLETAAAGQETLPGQRSVRTGRLRLTPEQKAELAKKAAEVNVQLANGNDAATARAERNEGEGARDEIEEVVEMP